MRELSFHQGIDESTSLGHNRLFGGEAWLEEVDHWGHAFEGCTMCTRPFLSLLSSGHEGVNFDKLSSLHQGRQS